MKYDINYKTKNECETFSEFTISDGFVSHTRQRESLKSPSTLRDGLINKDVYHMDAPSSLINRKRQETREFPIEAIRKEEANISASSQVKSRSNNKYTGYHTAQKKQSTLLKKSLYDPALLRGGVKDRPKKRPCSSASMRLSSNYIAKGDIPVNTTDAKTSQNDPIETKVKFACAAITGESDFELIRTNDKQLIDEIKLDEPDKESSLPVKKEGGSYELREKLNDNKGDVHKYVCGSPLQQTRNFKEIQNVQGKNVLNNSGHNNCLSVDKSFLYSQDEYLGERDKNNKLLDILNIKYSNNATNCKAITCNKKTPPHDQQEQALTVAISNNFSRHVKSLLDNQKGRKIGDLEKFSPLESGIKPLRERTLQKLESSNILSAAKTSHIPMKETGGVNHKTQSSLLRCLNSTIVLKNGEQEKLGTVRDFESDIRLARSLEPTIENKDEQKCSIIPHKEDQPGFTLRRRASLNLSSEKLSQSNNSFLFPRSMSLTGDYGKKNGDDKQVVSNQSQKVDEKNRIVEESAEVAALPQQGQETNLPSHSTDSIQNIAINQKEQYSSFIENQKFCEENLRIKVNNRILDKENENIEKSFGVTGLLQQAHEKVIPRRNTSIRHNTAMNREEQYFKLIEKQTFLEQSFLEIKTQDHISCEENKDEKLDTRSKRDKEAYLVVKDEEVSTNISFKKSKKGERDSSVSPSLLRLTTSVSNAKHYKKPSSLGKILRRGRSLEISKNFSHKLFTSCESLPKLVLSSPAIVRNSSDNEPISNIVKLKQLENDSKPENNITKIEEILKKKTNTELGKYALVESEKNNSSKYNACMNRHKQVMNRHKQVLSDNQIHETLESKDSLIEFDENTRNSSFEIIDTNSHKLGISKDTTDKQKDLDAWYLPKKCVFYESVDEVFENLTEFAERNSGFFFCSNNLESENDDEKSACYSLKDDETTSHKLFDVFRDDLPEQRTITLQEKRTNLKKTLDILKTENIVENKSSIKENDESILSIGCREFKENSVSYFSRSLETAEKYCKYALLPLQNHYSTSDEENNENTKYSIQVLLAKHTKDGKISDCLQTNVCVRAQMILQRVENLRRKTFWHNRSMLLKNNADSIIISVDESIISISESNDKKFSAILGTTKIVETENDNDAIAKMRGCDFQTKMQDFVHHSLVNFTSTVITNMILTVGECIDDVL